LRLSTTNLKSYLSEASCCSDTNRTAFGIIPISTFVRLSSFLKNCKMDSSSACESDSDDDDAEDDEESESESEFDVEVDADDELQLSDPCDLAVVAAVDTDEAAGLFMFCFCLGVTPADFLEFFAMAAFNCLLVKVTYRKCWR
jgi:hypothetical protein